MGPTVEELNKVLNIKKQIKQSIINKGVEITDTTPFADYPNKIDNIPDKYKDGYNAGLDKGYNNGYSDGYGAGYEEGSANGGGADPFYETMWNYITSDNTDYQYLFYDYKGTELDVSNLDTSKVTDMGRMFYNCWSLTSLDVSGWDTSNVTAMSNMFCNCHLLTSIDVSNFDTSKVTDMGLMFGCCYNLPLLDVSGWDTSKVTAMSNTFWKCQSLTSLDVSGWDTSKVTAMGSMFDKCTSLTTLDVSNFDMTKVTNTSNMFNSCTSLHTLYLDNCSNDTISKIISSKGFPTNAIEGVTRTIYCKEENAAGLTAPNNWVFEYIDKVEEPEEANPREIIWRTTNTKLYDEDGTLYFNGLYLECNGSQVPEGNITVLETDDQGIMTCSYTSDSDITSVQFSDGYLLAKPGLVEVIQLDTSKVTDMGNMFMNCNNLIRIPDLDVSSAENMSLMYYNCTSMTGYADPDKYWNNPNPNLWGMAMCFYGCTNLDNYDEIPEIPWIID